MIKVLVVDDSALMRKMISHILTSDPEIEVIDTAMDGVYALSKIEKVRPDVITLDIDMPRMDGLEALRQIDETCGIPTIIVSSLAGKNTETALRALELGAFDVVEKPQNAISVHIRDIAQELIGKVKAAHANPVARLKIKKLTALSHQKKQPVSQTAAPGQLLAIGISTGGPNALSYLLPRLPADFPAAILIVQHMPAGFTEMFSMRLNAISAITVKEARDGDLVVPGKALVAPGHRHMKVKRIGNNAISALSDAPPENGHKPSVDVLFRSVAAEYGACATALIMTGMGSDGARGIAEIRERGGSTVAQDEKSCVVFGMPKAAIETGTVQKVVSLDDLSLFLIHRFMQKEAPHGTIRG